LVAHNLGLRGSRQLKGRKAAFVLVAVEKRGQTSGRVRMAVLPDFKEATIHDFVKAHIAAGSTVYTEAYKSFDRLPVTGVRHVARRQPIRSQLRRGVPSAVPLADRAIGNLLQWLTGTYHGVSKAQLQVYLDEFVFRAPSPPATDGRIPDFAGLGHWPRADALSTDSGRPGSGGDLSAACWGLLKQPDKQERAIVAGLNIRACTKINWTLRRQRINRVIPIGMKSMPTELDIAHGLGFDFDALGIRPRVKHGLHA
jgi:transposase-like protein